jgi:peptidoglycan/LPS O-acetylase OafA/YrhL
MVGIDAVRAVAALAVVVGHIRRVPDPGPGEPGTAPWLTSVVQQSLGAWGVGVFFVLSGLCIHLPMARRRTSEPSATLALRPYFERRFVRIYPPHLVALILSALLALALPAWSLVGSALLSKPTASQFGLHLVMLHSFVPGAIGSINSVLWTIAVETHFYLLYPLLLAASRRVGFVRLTVALGAVSLLARAVGFIAPPWFATVAETNFICRLWEWSLGCCLAEALATRGAPPATSLRRFAALCVGSFALSPILRLGLRAMLGVHLGRAFGNEAVALVGPLLFALVVLRACGLADAGGAPFRALVALGVESYSLYLCHPLVLASWGWAFATLGLPHLAMAVTAVPATLLASRVFFRTVERRFLARAATVATPPA